jgi:hypothetical protein
MNTLCKGDRKRGKHLKEDESYVNREKGVT